MSDVLEDLERARKHFTGPDKWVKGMTKSREKQCLSAACTGGITYASQETRARLINAISELFPARYSIWDTVTGFNDCPDTKFEDVVAVLDYAIEVEKKLPGCVCRPYYDDFLQETTMDRYNCPLHGRKNK